MATERRSVVRLPDGAILLRMTPNERAILRALVDDLRSIVGRRDADARACGRPTTRHPRPGRTPGAPTIRGRR